MERAGFYKNLGVKDATHELSLVNLNAEDEKDFWADQKAFEILLEKKSPMGYQAYLNGKHQVYRAHQIHCGIRCDHSGEFIAHISYYLINGKSNSEAGLVLAPKKANKN
jgi:hypothetical protein